MVRGRWKRTDKRVNTILPYPSEKPLSEERSQGEPFSGETGADDALLRIEHATAHYGQRRRLFAWQAAPARVLDSVSLFIRRGETLALVGESGSGKSTLARAVIGLHSLSAGRILFEGRELAPEAGRRQAALQREIQIIFQNPDASLNRRHRVGELIGRPLKLFFGLSGHERQRRVAELLHTVQLPKDYARRFPGQISGGERQRVAIARALAAGPSLLLCDEIVSALDVSVQASILRLLGTLKTSGGLSLLFITHDLAVARWFADTVAVLHHGKLCEIGPVEQIFNDPRHPYTQSLIAAHH